MNDVLNTIKKWAPDASKTDDIVDTLLDAAKYRVPMEFIEDGLYGARTAAGNVWYEAVERAKKTSRDMIHSEHYYTWEERAVAALQTCSAEIQDRAIGAIEQPAIDWLNEVAAECNAIAILISNKEAAETFAQLLKGGGDNDSR